MPSNSKKLVGKPSAMEMTDMTISSSNGAATLGDEAINPAHANNVRFQDGDVSSASSGNGGVGKYSQSLTGSIRSSVKNLLTGESRAYQEFSAKRHKKKIAGEQFESFDYDAPDDRYKNYFIAAGAGGFGKKENVS
jgi:hypothetical protein